MSERARAMGGLGRPPERALEGWEPIAWQLWRYRRASYVEASRHLAAEGWSVHPVRIEAYCMAEAHRRLNKLLAGSRPPRRHVQPDGGAF